MILMMMKKKKMKMKNPIKMKMITLKGIMEIKIIIWKKKLITIMKEKVMSNNQTMANISRTNKVMRKRKKKSQMNSSTIQKKKLTVREFK